MTDAQLAVLLHQYATRLSELIDAAEEALPDDVKPVFTRKAHGLEQIAERIAGREPRDEYTWTACPALDQLKSFNEELKHTAEQLERGGDRTQTGTSRKGTTS